MPFAPKPVGAPIPVNMGAVADEYSFTRALRLAMDKIVKNVEARENELEDHMVRNLEKTRDQGGDTGASGQHYRVQIKDKEIAIVQDWPQFHAWIAQNGRFDLLQKRIADKAVLEMIEGKQAPPGTDSFKKPVVSVTKIR